MFFTGYGQCPFSIIYACMVVSQKITSQQPDYFALEVFFIHVVDIIQVYTGNSEVLDVAVTDAEMTDVYQAYVFNCAADTSGLQADFGVILSHIREKTLVCDCDGGACVDDHISAGAVDVGFYRKMKTVVFKFY